MLSVMRIVNRPKGWYEAGPVVPGTAEKER